MRTTSFAGITREREQHTVVHPLLENVDDTVLMKAVNLFKEKPTEVLLLPFYFPSFDIYFYHFFIEY